jgi:hypothetical protein
MNIFKKSNQKGQAIFEFIIFIPFLVFLYTIFYTIGNSINGSINQQKSVRGYFYTLVKGNSYLLAKNDLNSFRDEAVKKAGFFAIGWKEKQESKKQFAPCFKFSSMIKGSSDEECDSDTRGEEEGSSIFIRIFTVYGVCGAVYRDLPGANAFEFDPGLQSDAFGCSLSKSGN